MLEKWEIRALGAKEGDHWVAQCLEYDIGTQADNPDQLLRRLKATIEDEFEESMRRAGRPFFGIDPAPKYYEDRWNRCTKLFALSDPAIVETSCGLSIELRLVVG